MLHSHENVTPKSLGVRNVGLWLISRGLLEGRILITLPGVTQSLRFSENTRRTAPLSYLDQPAGVQRTNSDSDSHTTRVDRAKLFNWCCFKVVLQ